MLPSTPNNINGTSILVVLPFFNADCYDITITTLNCRGYSTNIKNLIKDITNRKDYFEIWITYNSSYANGLNEYYLEYTTSLKNQ